MGITTHGQHNSRTYGVWEAMVQRCTNPNCEAFKNYGGRGIEISSHWRSFENFLADMGEAPRGLTLERLDNEGNYERENCAWVTRRAQAANRRTNTMLTFRGETLCGAEWARRYGLSKSCLTTRLKNCWDLETALTTPSSKSNSVMRYKLKQLRGT